MQQWPVPVCLASWRTSFCVTCRILICLQGETAWGWEQRPARSPPPFRPDQPGTWRQRNINWKAVKTMHYTNYWSNYLQNRRNSIKSPMRDFQVHYEKIGTLFWCRLVVGRVDVFEYRCDYTLTHKVSGFSKSSLALRLATNNPAQQAVILTSRITQARNGVSGSDVTLRQHWRQVFFLWELPLLRLLLESRNWNVVQIRKSIIEWLNRLN